MKKVFILFSIFCPRVCFPSIFKYTGNPKVTTVWCKHVKSHDLPDAGQTHTHTPACKKSQICVRERERESFTFHVAVFLLK